MLKKKIKREGSVGGLGQEFGTEWVSVGTKIVPGLWW